MVAKPSEITPMTAYLLSELCIEAGLPKGVLNIVHGYGHKVGSAITAHPKIPMISFTGGTKTGATLNMNGGIHHIFFEPLAILNRLGGISYVDTCVSINYDYSQAPAGGCLFTSINNIQLSDVNFSIAPNPAKDQLTIETTKATTIEIMNVLGEKLVDRTIDKKEVISITNFNKGIYFIKDLTTGKTIKFVKE